MSVLDDPYDEATEGFGVHITVPFISDETIAHIKQELDKDKPLLYTDTIIVPQAQKETQMAEVKTKVDNSKIRELDPRILKVQEGFNARDYSTKANQEHIKNLTESIKVKGVLEALTVRYDTKTGEYFVVNGETRLRATLQAIKDGAPIKTVPVNFERKGTSVEERIASQILRNEGKQFDVLEQATIFKQLQDFGWKEAEIAKATSRTGPFVGAALKLAAAPAKLKKLITDGQISATLAIDILRAQEFDYEKAYAALSDAIATAAVTGSKKATAKHVDPEKKKKKKGDSGTPLYFQREMVRTFIDTLAEIAANTGLPKGVRNQCRDTLENVGLTAKEWLAQYEEDPAA